MRDSYQILPSDHAEMMRERRKTFALVSVVVIISLSLFSYPIIKDYKAKWDAYKAAQKFANMLSELKTKAMLKNTPLEARFTAPDIIEIFEVSSCGPNSKRTKLWDDSLSRFQSDIVFVNEAFVRKTTDYKDLVLNRFCYDPLYGSSLHADGVTYGTIFLANAAVLQRAMKDEEFDAESMYAELTVAGPSGDFHID